jgi:dTDP-4-dehydrorhamnose 3,5-epimerase
MSACFDIIAAPITGLHILQRKPIGDSRGYLERLFCKDELQTLLPGKRIEQVNHTLTTNRGTVRGLHFQYPPHAETKLVHCLRGEVFDVAVDLRRDSPTFLHWHAEVLSAENHRTLVIPEGFAHGFQALVGECEMLYFHTAAYRQEAEGGLHPEDPRIAIRWPLPVAGLSPRDTARSMLDRDFEGFAQ